MSFFNLSWENIKAPQAAHLSLGIPTSKYSENKTTKWR